MPAGFLVKRAYLSYDGYNKKVTKIELNGY